MDPNTLDEKYKKLAAEYSKLRAQASVLKRAVLDEQSKSSTLRESIRAKETALRRAEQEVDSLSFRNKQLEVRVASLQDDLVQDTKKSSKVTKTKSKATNNDDVPQHNNDTSLLFNEDLQKKIFENVRLETLVADKQSELQLQVMRIEELEARVAKMTADQSEHEGRLRRELERISAKNHDLEAKLVEASSIVGSDDTLYVSSECEQQQHTAATTCGDERVKAMEKELVYWRTQYEILKIGQKMQEQQCVAPNNVGHVEAGGDRDLLAEDKLRGEPENLLFNHFTVKIQELFGQKCMAESKLRIYVEECNSLQKHLDILTQHLKEQEAKFVQKQRDLRIADEDMATIRINYEEQIAVLTEQVISLSDQLASSR